MRCRTCKNESAYRITVIEGGDECCDRCGDVGYFRVPDLFVDGKPEINLPDDPKTGKPPVFTSRLEKERFLREHKLVEVRGKEHGGPSLPKQYPEENPTAGREAAMNALFHVKQMGRDYRRQEYQRIVKEAQKHKI